jgi:hypothetical protein
MIAIEELCVGVRNNQGFKRPGATPERDKRAVTNSSNGSNATSDGKGDGNGGDRCCAGDDREEQAEG